MKLLSAQLNDHSVPVVIGVQRQIAALEQLLAQGEASPNPVVIIGGGKVGRAVNRALKDRGVKLHIVERKQELIPRIGQIPAIVGARTDPA